jgi:antitoxin (DNA-binding transcriptional repressor) of toxin-antitoxin stability system
MADETIDMMALVRQGPVVEITPEGVLITTLVPMERVVQVGFDEPEGS